MHGLALLLLVLISACTASTVPAGDAVDPASVSPAPPTTAFVGVTVIDGTGAPPVADRTVLVQDGEILEVGARDSVGVPDDARIVDGAGRWLIPGLWDLHTHLSKSRGSSLKLFVAAGVTGVRDLGGDWEELSGWRDEVRAGERVGPRMLLAGSYLEAASNVERMRTARAEGRMIEPVERTRVPFSDSASAVHAVDSVAALGVDWIKFRTVPSMSAYRAIVAAAHAHGLPVTGHTFGIPADRVLETGQESIEHFLFPLLDDLSVEERAALFRRFAEQGTAVVPTLIAGRPPSLQPVAELREMMDDSLGSDEPRMRRISRYLRNDWAEQLAEREESADGGPDWEAVHRSTIRDLREMHAAGVRILPGSDVAVIGVFPGTGLHDELELLVREVGMTEAEALHAATGAAADFLGVADSVGTVRAGMAADLVLLDADPLASISNTRRIAGVVRAGRWHDRAALDALLAEIAAAADVRAGDWR